MFNFILLFIITYTITTTAFFYFLEIKDKRIFTKKFKKQLTIYFFIFYSGLPTFGVFFLKNNTIINIINSTNSVLLIILMLLVMVVFYNYYHLYFAFVNTYKCSRKYTQDEYSFIESFIIIIIITNIFIIIPLILFL